MFGFGLASLLTRGIFRGVGYALMACCCCFAVGKLLKCQIRDCACCKRLLRWIGHDKFDDFDVMVVVVEASCEHRKEKMKTFVRVVAGHHFASTDASSKGKFQQPLHIHVSQGTPNITIELWEEKPSGAIGGTKCFASMHLDCWKEILNAKDIEKPQPRKLVMKKKGMGIDNPSVTFYMSVGESCDEESGLLASSQLDIHSDTKMMLQQQLKKAAKPTKAGISSGDTGSEEGVSEIQQLKRACAGNLDRFEGFGGTRHVYVAVRGPPDSRSWIVGVWSDKEDFERRAKGIVEIDVKRIKGIQQDPMRSNVFVINFFDQNRDVQKECFRIIDLNRDVWVNMLKMMVLQVRKSESENKKNTSSSHREKTRKSPA